MWLLSLLYKLNKIKLNSLNTFSTNNRRYAYFDWWLARHVWHKKVHGKVFTVEVLIHLVPYCLWHHITVDVHVVLQTHNTVLFTAASCYSNGCDRLHYLHRTHRSVAEWLAHLSAVWQDQGSKNTADGCVYRDSCCTFTAEPRSTQPSTLRGTVKRVSAYKPSNNNNDNGGW